MSQAALTLHPIRDEADYRQALKQAEAFFDAAQEPDPDSEEGAHFEALITLIEAYETGQGIRKGAQCPSNTPSMVST